MLYFVLHIRGAKNKGNFANNILLSEVYVKVNCHPAMFEVDLLGEIEPEHPKTRCRVGGDKVTLNLKKKEAGLWEEFRFRGTKAEIRERRQAALDAAAARETARLTKRTEWREEKLKEGEHEQWRLDRENREQIETWEQEEKQKWDDAMYASFDEETGALKEAAAAAPTALGDLDDIDAPDVGLVASAAPPLAAATPVAPAVPRAGEGNVAEVTDEEAEAIRAQKQREGSDPQRIANSDAIWTDKELDDTEEYFPDVRDNPGKIGIRFTMRPRAGVPVRDRGQRAPPFPKQQVKGELPPMIAGDEPADENDPVWLKDKADKLMVNGDYQGACNAYTAALKIALNARAFANRAAAQLYLGNLEQCLEDCTSGLRILDKRQKVPEGQMSGTVDPQDQLVRARLEVRMGTAYLWLGAFAKAEHHFQKALDTEDGLDIDEKAKVKDDTVRVQSAKVALSLKEKADIVADRAYSGKGGIKQAEILNQALHLYEEAHGTDPRSVVILANRSFARLRASQFSDCVEDCDKVLELLKQWPTARRAPKTPALPAHLDPPFLDDPTFKHPDEQKQGEVDWLMKHGGGNFKDLPSVPLEYEWVKDVAEKSDNSWIAIRKKMPKVTIDAIRRATTKLQDVLWTRNPRIIRDHLVVAIDENKAGEGPSNKAIRQSDEFAEKLEAHAQVVEAERAQLAEEARQEIEDYDLDLALAASRSGVAQLGFGRNHPVERTKRRLFVKVLLRKARALEALGDKEACVAELQRVLRVEPNHVEGKQLLAGLVTPPSTASAASPSSLREASAACPDDAIAADLAAGLAAGSAAARAFASGGGLSTAAVALSVAGSPPVAPTGPGRPGKHKVAPAADFDDDDDGEGGVDHSSTEQLLNVASEYMKKNDYEGALQIYNYAERRCKEWDSALTELKVLSNRSLCLQRCRGRLPELISACNDALARISALQRDPTHGGIEEDMLLKMQCACLSRRGNAYMQQRETEKGNRDLVEVRDLLARQEALEARDRPPLAG